MYYYKTTIQYEGTNYAGFQWQKGIQTVQRAFNNSLSRIIEGKITTIATSRTDTGVHATEQVVKISSENPIDILSFVELLNKTLPQDIRCLDIDFCESLYRPSVAAASKEYRYLFTNKLQVAKEDGLFVANISNKLDIDAINICIKNLIGQHDFCNFYSSGSNVKSTTREIIFCELSQINPHDIFLDSKLFQLPTGLTSCYQLKIVANGFLKQMIRHIVSALWMVGSGKLSVEEFTSLLNSSKNPKQLWKVASPNGLFLFRIHFL